MKIYKEKGGKLFANKMIKNFSIFKNPSKFILDNVYDAWSGLNEKTADRFVDYFFGNELFDSNKMSYYKKVVETKNKQWSPLEADLAYLDM